MKPLVTISTYEERQEELRKTSMMRDETDHRSTPHQQQQTFNDNHNNNNNNDIINKNYNHMNHNNKNYSNGHQNSFNKTELIQNQNGNNSIGQFPTPPPPPQFANIPPPPMIKISDDDDHIEIQTISSQITTMIPPPPDTPIPDYDSSPMNSNRKQQQNYHANGCVRVTTATANIGTIGRVASTEIAKANGDIGELESIDSYKLQNPSSPQPKPPSAYFVAQSSGPPTMKKTNRPVSVTIGEYGGGAVGYRKEPSKFDFIAKSNENSPTSSLPSPTTPTNGIKEDGNVSNMLRSELEMTLSRSNLKKRNEFDRSGINQIQNGAYNNGFTQNGGTQIQNGGNKIQNGNCNYQKYQNDVVGHQQNGKPILQKTQSSNIEKLTNMLQNKQHIFEQNNNDRNSTLTNSNRVTINIPNNNNNTITTSTGKIELRKTESIPTNGILKNGLTRTSYVDKSISFGN